MAMWRYCPYASPTQDFKPLQRPSGSPIPKFSVVYWLFNRSVSKNLVARFVSTQGCYTINDDRSSAVQFMRSDLRGRSIYRGRIRAQLKYLDKEQMALLPKEAEFGAWYYSCKMDSQELQTDRTSHLRGSGCPEVYRGRICSKSRLRGHIC